jgi:hypothetical protein
MYATASAAAAAAGAVGIGLVPEHEVLPGWVSTLLELTLTQANGRGAQLIHAG